MHAVDAEDRATKDVDLRHDDHVVERALDINWCIESHSFQFRITLKDNALTRRGLLATISSIYDPLCFHAPVVLVAKQILQHMHTSYEQWRLDILRLSTMNIRRYYKPEGFGKVMSVVLHHFSDATTTGHGQCSYCRLKDDDQRMHRSLVTGKATVTPLKPESFPLLELTAALVSVTLNVLPRQLDYDVNSEMVWTDSRVVFVYIANEARRFHVFVANKVQHIRDDTHRISAGM